MMKISVFLFLCAFLAQKLPAASMPAYFNDLRGQISSQVSVATNSAAPNKKLAKSLKRSLFLIDRDSSTNLLNHTRTLELVASTLNKTSISNVFDAGLQSVVNKYYDAFTATKAALVFPANLRPVKLKNIDLLTAALKGADTNPDTVIASKYLVVAAKRMVVVQRFAVKTHEASKPISNPSPSQPAPTPTPPPTPNPSPTPTPPPAPAPTPTPPPAPAPTSDLSQLENNVFVAGEGFNTLQFAPNGKLGFIAWRGRDLLYRERNGSTWSERVIGSYGSGYSAGGPEEYRFQPFAA
ncbi:MAG: hypothetical protein ABIQ35_06315, partial [Verrucomicrobiota bacterium]